MADRFSTNGFLLVDKPGGMTSQQTVVQVKKALDVHRVGHGGTLDPMATGLLVIAIGRATRLLGYFSDKDKQYTGTMRLGQGTTTDDAEGDPLGTIVDATSVTEAVLRETMDSYLGLIEQVPSTVSAIKVNGRRAYARAREGEVFTLKPRPVTISRFDLDQRRNDPPWVDVDFTVECSSGTYVRALARDVGTSLGASGHLTALRRTRVGSVDVEDAITLENLKVSDIKDMAMLADHIAPRIYINELQAREVAVGRGLDILLADDPTCVFFDSELLALYHRDPQDPNRALPIAVLIDPGDRRFHMRHSHKSHTQERTT